MSFKSTICVLLAVLAKAAVGAPETLGEVTSYPKAVGVNSGLPIVISVQIPDPTVIPGSVYVFLVDDSGRPATRIGALNDSGLFGDAVAGDQTYSALISLPTSTPVTFSVRVTAAFSGSLRRTESFIGTVEVASGADSTIPSIVASTTALKLVVQSGATLFQTPLRTSAVTLSIPADGSGEDTIITDDKVIVSRYGNAAALFTEATKHKSLLDETNANGEYIPFTSRISLIRGLGIAWTREAAEDNTFYIGDQIISGNGEATLLVECEINCSLPTISVLSSVGATTLSFKSSLGSVLDPKISIDGKYIAYLGRVPGAILGTEFSFTVIDVSTQKSWDFRFGYSKLGTGIEEVPGRGFLLVHGDGTILAQLP